MTNSSLVPDHVPFRSNEGCWTCRLRKKKCDETRPDCLACLARGLQCHGTKPTWINSSLSEQIYREGIKKTVKESYRRRRIGIRSESLTQQRSPALSNTDPTRCNKDTSGLQSLDEATDETDCQWPPDADVLELDYLTTPASTTNSTEVASHYSGNSSLDSAVDVAPSYESRYKSDRALLLLVYFHDCVFDSMFPFYALRPPGTNRGWLPFFTTNKGSSNLASLGISATYLRCMKPGIALPDYPESEAFEDEQLFSAAATQVLSKELEAYIMTQHQNLNRAVECSKLLFSILQLLLATVS